MKSQALKTLLVLMLLCLAAAAAEAEPARSYSFLLSGVENRTVSFQGGQGCAWKNLSYECNRCSFLVHQAGVTRSVKADSPGVLMNLRENGNELGLTCRAYECVLTSISSSGRAESQKLTAGMTGVVPASAHLSITVTDRKPQEARSN